MCDHRVPAGIGEPVFHKLDAALCSAVMSIGAVKGVEIGDGFQAAAALGSNNNDSFRLDAGKLTKATNHSGGTLGGMSDGQSDHTAGGSQANAIYLPATGYRHENRLSGAYRYYN